MIENSVSIVMPVHNQEDIIGPIIKSIFDCSSENVKEVIIILDGCTDNTEEIVVRNLVYKRDDMTIKLVHTDDVWETIACNIGFEYSECEYSLNIQDDMKILEVSFDKRLMKPFFVVPNLLGVTARDAVDARIINGNIDYYNVAGKDVNTPRNLFCIRDIINRGPILFKNSVLKELNYLDADFAPLAQDDSDISARAYKKGYLVGSYVTEYYSPLEWGQTRKNSVSGGIIAWSEAKNMKLLMERHLDYILAPKHDQDIILE